MQDQLVHDNAAIRALDNDMQLPAKGPHAGNNGHGFLFVLGRVFEVGHFQPSGIDPHQVDPRTPRGTVPRSLAADQHGTGAIPMRNVSGSSGTVVNW